MNGFPFTKNDGKGFTLIELAMVLVIAGVLLTAVITIVLPLMAAARLLETQEKIEKVSDYLNAYAVENFRLPCPAEANNGGTAGGEPYGFEAGSGGAGDAIPAGACPLTEGIPPFNTLGIQEELLIDGWGNYITYAVNPNFAQNTQNGLPANVHPACRTREWLYDSGVDPTGERTFRNKNPRKARFCCPDLSIGANSDLVVNDEDDNFVLAFDRTATPPTDGYQDPDTLMAPIDPATGLPLGEIDPSYYEAPQVPPADERSTAVVYVLVSHGSNGLGAFSPNAGVRLNLPPGGSEEEENTNGDNTYMDRQTYSQNVNLFDDVVLWRTQDLVFAAEGESCSAP